MVAMVFFTVTVLGTVVVMLAVTEDVVVVAEV